MKLYLIINNMFLLIRLKIKVDYLIRRKENKTSLNGKLLKLFLSKKTNF